MSRRAGWAARPAVASTTTPARRRRRRDEVGRRADAVAPSGAAVDAARLAGRGGLAAPACHPAAVSAPELEPVSGPGLALRRPAGGCPGRAAGPGPGGARTRR